MVVEKGYKQTEVGVIPEDWEIVIFSNVSFIKGRIGWQGLKQTEFNNNADDPFLITGMNFKDGEIRWDEVYHVSENRYQLAKEIQLKTGDVLMTKDGTIGKLLYVDLIPYPHKATLNSHLLLFRPLRNSFVPKYLYYHLASPSFLKHIELTKSGTTFFGISQASVREYNLILPPHPEQTAIANALSDMDALIAQTEKLIEKKKAIKLGVMQELLKPKEGWVRKKLGEVCEIYQPQTISADKFTNDGYIVYGANGIVGYYNQYNHKEWQVMITCRGSTCGTVNKSVNFSWITGNSMVMNVDYNKNIDKVFFYYLLLKQDFSQTITGSGQPQIVRAPLANYWIKMPTEIEEQKMIGETLKDIDSSIEKLENKLQKLKHQKQGMMQTLLTGKIRLIK